MDAINHLEHKLYRLGLTRHLSTLLEPIEEVLQQYTSTLCTAQKKMSFVNTLLQDITESRRRAFIASKGTKGTQQDIPTLKEAS